MKITDHAEHAEQQQNSFVKEEVKKKEMCAFRNNEFTQLCIFGYKVG